MKLRWAQVGHPNPTIQRLDSSIHQKGLGRLPVDLIQNATYGEFTKVLEPGDHLLIPPEGITETFNQSVKILG